MKAEIKELITQAASIFTQENSTPDQRILHFGNDSCYFISCEQQLEESLLLIKGVGIEARDYRKRPRGTPIISVSPIIFLEKRNGADTSQICLNRTEAELLQVRGVRKFVRVYDPAKPLIDALVEAVGGVWKVVEAVEVVKKES